MDHHRLIIMDNSIDSVFGNDIVIVATNITVFDTLTLGDNFIDKIFGSVDAIFGTVLLDENSGGCILTLKFESCLDGFSYGKTELM